MANHNPGIVKNTSQPNEELKMENRTRSMMNGMSTSHWEYESCLHSAQGRGDESRVKLVDGESASEIPVRAYIIKPS